MTFYANYLHWTGDNLHKMSNPVFWENKKSIINLSSADLVERMVKVIMSMCGNTDYE